KFVEANGYDDRRWWTEAGWATRGRGINLDPTGKAWKLTGKSWNEPRFWHDDRFNQPDYPVVGISWYEAIAFCLWLCEMTGENITLPTEQGWQWAAQKYMGWAYPWGEKFDEKRCNFNTQGTTTVAQYAGRDKGDSPFGVSDMSGNVWEWCLTDYESGVQDF